MHTHPDAPEAMVAAGAVPVTLESPPITDAVTDSERIQAIDVARGIAILGIFMVNMQLFAGPFGEMMGVPRAPEGSSWADALAYYFVLIFCAGKFYPLFSTLFGIGFMIQLERAEQAGRRFMPAYLRRLAFLCVLGLIHGLLLWYGDILFIYSIAGTLLFATVMIFRRISPRALLWSGVVMVLVSAAVGTALNLVFGGPPPTENAQVDDAGTGTEIPATSPSTAPAEIPATNPSTAPAASDSPSGRLFAGFQEGTVRKGPVDPIWMETETAAYRDGPWIESFIFRAMSFGMMILFTIITGFGLHVLGMFFIGAGLLRARVFSRDRLGLHRRLFLLGLLLGLPIVLAGVFLPKLVDNQRLYVLMGMTNMVGGPLMSLGYLSAATLIAASGMLKPVVAAVARVGRMALTNYLTETVVATFLMYHWGLGWFGSVSPAQQVLIVLCVYAALLVTSTIWLRFFLFGPMEWLWRTATYLRPQPLLRRTQR